MDAVVKDNKMTASEKFAVVSSTRKVWLFGARSDSEGMTKLIADSATKHLATVDTLETAVNSNVLKVIDHSSPSVERSEKLCEFFLKLFRAYGCHRNERETILSPTDQLIAVQLLLATQNKETLGEFDVDVSDVLSTLTDLITYKLNQALPSSNTPESNHRMTAFCHLYDSFLRDCNARDWSDVVRAVITERRRNVQMNELISNTDFLCVNISQHDNIENRMLRELCAGHELAMVSLSLSLDESFTQSLIPGSAETTIEICSEAELLSEMRGAEKARDTVSASEVYAEQILLGYIELLVNSRNEFALARVINVPDRGIDHGAFTDIKHEAKEREMSMYQTITSFIMRIRLGGRSYAPGTECALLKHTKGLSEFTDLMHKLQTIVEEDSSPLWVKPYQINQ